MKRTKGFIIILLFSAMSLCLVSCAQGQVNGDRLPGGVPGGQESGGDTQDSTDGDAQSPTDGSTQSPLSDWVPPSLEDCDPEDPYGFKFFVEIEGSTFEDTRANYPPGTILYTVTSAGLYDSLEEAGISEESYAVFGAQKYDHYVKVDITVQNVDVTETEDYLINSFRLACPRYPLREAVWFSLGASRMKRTHIISITISRPPGNPSMSRWPGGSGTGSFRIYMTRAGSGCATP